MGGGYPWALGPVGSRRCKSRHSEDKKFGSHAEINSPSGGGE